MNRSSLRFLATLVAACFVLAACGGGGDDGSTASTTNTGGGGTGGGGTGGGGTGGGGTGGGGGGGGTTTGAATLTWMPPTTYSDNSPLVIDHYTIYYGTNQNSLINTATAPGGVSTFTVDQLASGTWYFTITAVDGAGVESTFSNFASKTI